MGRQRAQQIGIGMVLGAIIGLICWFGWQRHFILSPFSDKVNDLLFDVVPTTDDRLVTIEIDEKTLDRALAEGIRWPFPRQMYAKAVDNLIADGAKVIAIDLLFMQPDSVDPAKNDPLLAASLKKAGNVVLGSQPQFPPNQGAGLLVAQKIDMPLPPLAEAAKYVGHVNFLPSETVLRRLPVLVETADRDLSVPLSVAALAAYQGFDPRQASYKLGDTLIVGDLRLPIDEKGQMIVNYSVSTGGFPRESFVDVMDGKFRKGRFRDKLVLVGPHALRLQDQWATPIKGQINTYGMEIHANVIDSLLQDKLVRPVSARTNLVIFVAMGAVGGLLLSKLPLLWGTLGVLALFLGYTVLWTQGSRLGGLSVSLGAHNRAGLIFDLVYPATVLALTYVSVTVYNYMQEQRSRASLNRAFGRFMSPQIVDYLMEQGSPDLLKPGGKRQMITVLFSDIRGYTSLSEGMTPEELFVVLNQYLDILTRVIIEKYDGYINKYMGDAILAIWNAPRKQRDHARLAVACALEMQRSLKESGLTRGDGGAALACGIGVTSGEAMLGIVGSAERLEFTVIGDTVNTASRLQGQAADDVYISETTYRLVEDEFEVEQLEPMSVKGKAEPVQVYRVLGAKQRLETAAAARIADPTPA